MPSCPAPAVSARRVSVSRLPDGVTGTQLFGLQGPLHLGVGEGGAHRIAAVTEHDTGVRGLEGRCGTQHVPKQRAVRQGLQYLGQGGAHALALTGCKNDDLHRAPYGGKPRGF